MTCGQVQLIRTNTVWGQPIICNTTVLWACLYHGSYWFGKQFFCYGPRASTWVSIYRRPNLWDSLSYGRLGLSKMTVFHCSCGCWHWPKWIHGESWLRAATLGLFRRSAKSRKRWSIKDSSMAIPPEVPGVAHSTSPTCRSTSRDDKISFQFTAWKAERKNTHFSAITVKIIVIISYSSCLFKCNETKSIIRQTTTLLNTNGTMDKIFRLKILLMKSVVQSVENTTPCKPKSILYKRLKTKHIENQIKSTRDFGQTELLHFITTTI